MVFIRTAAGAEPKCFNVATTIGKGKTVKGQLGLEIEVEGKKLPKEEVTAPWVYHKDGSLRGQDNAEYVLHRPIEFDALPKALDGLWERFREKGSLIDDSNRTSVHVHLNVQNFFLNRLTSFMALYFTFEEVLTQWCGDHRVGNLFCMRAKDAPAITSQIRQFIKSDMRAPLRDHHHYAALNANALHKFGSLEFRALRGVGDPKIILQWVGVLRRLYDLSDGFRDPRTLCDQFSSGGPSAFFDNMLGEYASVIRDGITTMTEDDIRQSLYEGIRFAQDLCFCRDWDKFISLDLSPDPFGRDPRKVAARINTPASEGIDLAMAEMYVGYMGNEGAPADMPDFEPEYDDESFEDEGQPHPTPTPAATWHTPPFPVVEG